MEAGSRASLQLPTDEQEERLANEEQFGDTMDLTAAVAGEEPYMFYPDKLPSQRQLYYQLCDLKEDSLQEIIHSNDGRETECDVRADCLHEKIY